MPLKRITTTASVWKVEDSSPGETVRVFGRIGDGPEGVIFDWPDRKTAPIIGTRLNVYIDVPVTTL